MIPGVQGIHPVIGASSPPGGTGATPAHQNTGAFIAQSSDPLPVGYPAGLQNNDIAFIHVALVDALVANAWTTPAGWTEVSNQTVNGVTAGGNAVYWKRLNGSETGSVSLTSSAGLSGSDTACGIMSVWRGAIASGTPYEQLGNNTGSSANMTGSAVTTTGANRRILNFGCYAFSGTATTATPSAGWDEQYDNNTPAGSTGAGVFCHSIEKAAAGALAGATHVLSASRQWQEITIALIPA